MHKHRGTRERKKKKRVGDEHTNEQQTNNMKNKPHTRTQVNTHIHTYTCTHTHTHIHMYTHTQTTQHSHTRQAVLQRTNEGSEEILKVRTGVGSHVPTLAHDNVQAVGTIVWLVHARAKHDLNTHIHTHIHTYTHIHTHTYTHIHTHTCAQTKRTHWGKWQKPRSEGRGRETGDL